MVFVWFWSLKVSLDVVLESLTCLICSAGTWLKPGSFEAKMAGSSNKDRGLRRVETELEEVVFEALSKVSSSKSTAFEAQTALQAMKQQRRQIAREARRIRATKLFARQQRR